MERNLPRNAKEGILFGSIICLLTCTVMATLNICTTMGGINKESMSIVVKAVPLVFVIAMVVEGAVVGKVAEKLVARYTLETDGFNAKVMFNIFFTVIGMSAVMTLVGGILNLGFTTEIFEEFIHVWPRNFCIAFLLELLVVQPFARAVMCMIHKENCVVTE